MENKGGCITCRKCEQVRINFYCGRKKLSQKQLYNTHGFCSNYEPKEQIEKPLTNEEWLKQCTTEQLADVIADFYLLGFTHGHNQMDITSRTKWTEWLKEKHHDSVQG